ncbi:MAG: M4 family metallopeptidase [Myxococcota bacterium]
MKTRTTLIAALLMATTGPAFDAQAALSDQAVIRLSYDALQAKASSLGLKSARDEFRPRQVVRDELGRIHVRMDQYYRGLPVFGEQVITHFDSNGRLLRTTGDFVKPYAVNTQPLLTARQALDLAMSDFGQAVSHAPEVKLSVVRLDQGGMYLAYQVKLTDIESANPKAHTYFVNARTGLFEWDFTSLETEAAQGVGHSFYSGDVPLDTDKGAINYTLLDTVRGGAQTTDMKNGTSGNGVDFNDADNDWGSGNKLDSATAAVDAHFGAALTWDFYESNFGRRGIKDDGKGALSRVHYSSNYVNAFWSDSCFCMTYGDGNGTDASALVSIDVAAHEMTHGVTSATAGLIYSNQPGGLNESFSDIFGTAVEFFAEASGIDTVAEYDIGEDIWTPNKAGDALRYMDQPSKDGRSIDHARQYKRGMDPHYSSGVANNVFYLLANGGTNPVSKTQVKPIGIEKAQTVFYYALVTELRPRSDYAAAAQACYNAARANYDQATADAVRAGWAAAGVTF